eukprot:gene4135-5889_t
MEAFKLEHNELCVDVVSTRGLSIPRSIIAIDLISSLKIIVLYENMVSTSGSIAGKFIPGEDEEIILNHSAKFSLKSFDIDSIQPIHLYLVQQVDHSNSTMYDPISGFQPVGITNARILIAQAIIDARLALLHPQEYLSVELVPCNSGGVIDTGFCGIIYLKLHASGAVTNIIDLKNGVEVMEMKRKIEISQKFIEKQNFDQYQSLKLWYGECRTKYPYLEDRKLRLISLDECGRHRLVCNFVGSVKPPRYCDGPRFSARMVSLIPFYRGVELIGGNVSSWSSPCTTMMKLQGDVEDHAILLCSLLLGWGMDAYVAYGTIYPPNVNNGNNNSYVDPLDQIHQHHHYWVVTLDGIDSTVDEDEKSTMNHRSQSKEAKTSSRSSQTTSLHQQQHGSSKQSLKPGGYVTFWEPLTGQQYQILISSKNQSCVVIQKRHENQSNSVNNHKQRWKHPFKNIYSLFRHNKYLINIQISPNVSDDLLELTQEVPMASFDIDNKNYWQPFLNFHYDRVKHPGANVPMDQMDHFLSITSANIESRVLSTVNNHILNIEINIEQAIQQIIKQMREAVGLQTTFSDNLAIKLQPALLAYEFDRVVGMSFGNEDFQLSIKNIVSSGECFLAYPTCFSSTHIPTIINTLHKTDAFRDVVLVKSGGGSSGMNSGLASYSNVGIAKLTNHAVRIKVVPYSDSICAVWIMIGVCYLK